MGMRRVFWSPSEMPGWQELTESGRRFPLHYLVENGEGEADENWEDANLELGTSLSSSFLGSDTNAATSNSNF